MHARAQQARPQASKQASKHTSNARARSQGFAAGLDGGLVALFERDDREKEGFRRARTLALHDRPSRVRRGGGGCGREGGRVSGQRSALLACCLQPAWAARALFARCRKLGQLLPPPHPARCMSVSPAEDQLALLLESGPAFTLSLLNQAGRLAAPTRG
jgi:hypothetical protein